MLLAFHRTNYDSHVGNELQNQCPWDCAINTNRQNNHNTLQKVSLNVINSLNVRGSSSLLRVP